MSPLVNGHRVAVPPGKVADPWDYQDPALHAVAKCRIIPVTQAMRDADQRRQQQQVCRPSDWKLGAEIRSRIATTSERKVVSG